MADVKLFEQTEDTNPTLSMRLAFGKVATPTGNITLQNFVSWLLGKLAFLKVANNLSDLDNAATARSNLAVYSKTETDTLLLAKENSITSTAWLDGSIVSSKVKVASFILKAKRWGNVVTFNGQFELTSVPTAGEVLFALPAAVGVPSINVYFGTDDADSDVNMELYVASGTSNITTQVGGSDKVHVFNATFII